MQLIAASHFSHADIMRLDVPMGDTLLFEERYDLQQVLAEPLQQPGVQPASAKPIPQRLGARTTDQQAHAIAQFERAQVFDDVLVSQLLQHFALITQSLVVLRRGRDLQNGFSSLGLDQQDFRGRSGAEFRFDDQAARELVADFGLHGVFDHIVIDRQQFPLNLVQVFQEVACRLDPVSHIGACGNLNQILQVLTRPVDDRADLQSIRVTHLLGEFQTVGGRGLAGKQMVSDRAQREDVQVLASSLVFQESLGRHVRRAEILDQSVDVAGRRHGTARRARAAVADLPVEDLDLRSLVVKVDDQDALWRQRAMHDTLIVCEPHDVRDLPKEI